MRDTTCESRGNAQQQHSCHTHFEPGPSLAKNLLGLYSAQDQGPQHAPPSHKLTISDRDSLCLRVLHKQPTEPGKGSAPRLCSWLWILPDSAGKGHPLWRKIRR
jgi:hypothetical protein